MITFLAGYTPLVRVIHESQYHPDRFNHKNSELSYKITTIFIKDFS